MTTIVGETSRSTVYIPTDIKFILVGEAVKQLKWHV